ncbi:hypothetical protein [Streptosporangium sp. V21-05]
MSRQSQRTHHRSQRARASSAVFFALRDSRTAGPGLVAWLRLAG